MAGVRKQPVIDGMKVCLGCGVSKPFTPEFYTRDASAPGGLTSRCKECRYKKKREWEIENPEKNREAQRNFYAITRDSYLPRKQKWRSENRDKDRASSRNWIKNNPERHVEYYKKWISIPENKLAQSLRARVRRCIKEGRVIYRDMENVLGYSINDLKKHIESTFEVGMSWENYSFETWHIDHIRPVSSFKLTNEDGGVNYDEVKKCWALNNLRAMWGNENMSKSDKWDVANNQNDETNSN